MPVAQPKVTAAQVKKQLDFLSGQLSDRTRWLAGAVLAGSWAIFTQQKGLAFPWLLLVSLTASVACILCDFAQYVGPYIYSVRLYEAAYADPSKTALASKSWLQDARHAFFFGKLACAAVAALFFIAAAADAANAMRAGAVKDQTAAQPLARPTR